ncbi:MAG TPA: alpha/beta hydrolase [Acidimicrobiia bacterium]|nr:alpha/beta hydrolase [Acidimicrobiia bacterium]
MTNVPASTPLAVTTADGFRLEAEYALPSDTRAAALVVLCHPHPLHGGTMRSLVTSALFTALPATDVAAARFNFRGVEGSEGTHGGGTAEITDVLAILDATAALAPGAPRAVVGWSFGGDVALQVHDPRLAAWVAIAPPLRFGRDFAAVADDERPKLVVLAEHDEVREPAAVVADLAGWRATRVETVTGASHFFVGRTDRVSALVAQFVRDLPAG